MWDQRYSDPTYAYGKQPNDFLVQEFGQLVAGKVLCLAEGEGRNAVWLAEQGMQVTAVDASAVGLEKARKLAAERAVSITTVHADLSDFAIGCEQWDSIVSIFAHLPPALRANVHQRCVQGLKPGGVLLLEAYTPRQLEFKTGGPPVADMMMDEQSLMQELQGLDILWLREKEREIHEGEYHTGMGAVVQLLARKPADAHDEH